MTDDLYLRRKWTLRAHGHQVIFIKKANENAQHVLRETDVNEGRRFVRKM